MPDCTELRIAPAVHARFSEAVTSTEVYYYGRHFLLDAAHRILCRGLARA
jgi:hypothetical protein